MRSLSLAYLPHTACVQLFDASAVRGAGTIYYGKAGEACAAYFLKVGFPTPSSFNPADHFLDIISINYRSESEIERTKATVERLTAAWLESDEQKFWATEVRRPVRPLREGRDQGAPSTSRPTDINRGGGGGAAQMVAADQLHAKANAALMAAVHSGPGFTLPFRLLAARAWREQLRNTPELCMK